MTEPEALQELREALAASIFNESEAIVRSFVKWADNIGDWRRVKFYRLADACIEAIRGAGWGPTAAHPDQDSGLTAPSPAAHLPSGTAPLLDTPQIEALLAAIAPAPWVESGPDSIAEGCVYSTADGWKVCEADVIINDPDDPHGATWLPAFTLITRERGWERANANAALIAAAPDLAATSLAALTEVASLRAALQGQTMLAEALQRSVHALQIERDEARAALQADALAVSWSGDVPFVTTVEYDSASEGSIVVHDKDESLRRMWALISAGASHQETGGPEYERIGEAFAPGPGHGPQAVTLDAGAVLADREPVFRKVTPEPHVHSWRVEGDGEYEGFYNRCEDCGAVEADLLTPGPEPEEET